MRILFTLSLLVLNVMLQPTLVVEASCVGRCGTPECRCITCENDGRGNFMCYDKIDPTKRPRQLWYKRTFGES